jgi:hypothetical protein
VKTTKTLGNLGSFVKNTYFGIHLPRADPGSMPGAFVAVNRESSISKRTFIRPDYEPRKFDYQGLLWRVRLFSARWRSQIELRIP